MTMQDTALYQHLLGLKSPWSVSRVDLNVKGQRVERLMFDVRKPTKIYFANHRLMKPGTYDFVTEDFGIEMHE
jgi:hypothetical protein